MKHLISSVTIKDCDVSTFRSGGPGGQNQNKRETGVRIVHRDSGAVGESREERSQLINKRRAFERMALSAKFREWNKQQVLRARGIVEEGPTHGSGPSGFGARTIRTYHFVDGRVKDHRTGHTRNDVQAVMDGDIDSFIQAMMDQERSRY